MIGVTVLLAAAAAVGGPAGAHDLAGALEQTRELVEQHRYREVIEILDPYRGSDEPEARYAVAAETGRALFHLGNYEEAYRCLREAVALRPQLVETALYLEAAAYLVGDRPLAYTILREILRSGATDLYLAVTLPGERRFMADAAVWEILEAAAIPLDTDLRRGAVLGVRLGRPKSEVEATLAAGAGVAGQALTARAGPYLTWAFGFGDSGELIQIMLHVDHLLRYTPFRPRFTAGMDWRATPETATSVLGQPTRTASADEVLVMSWDLEDVRTTLEFAPPRTPVPPGLSPDRPTLRVVRLESIRPGPTDRAP